jgi:hypothetical protein
VNERIQQLAEQAEEEAYVEYAKKETGYTFQQLFLNKFVELIKQAIYNVVKEELMDDAIINAQSDTVIREYLKGRKGGTEEALYDIKNFGVEQ